MLTPIWEPWNWEDSQVDFWGVILLLVGVFALGFISGRGDDEKVSGWTIAGLVAGFIGIMLLVANTPPIPE